jgi:lambda family phage portal protein
MKKGSPPKGNITARLPKPARRIRGHAAKPKYGALNEPGVADDFYFGRSPYRDAGPAFWSGGGSVLFAPSISSANREIVKYRDRAVANAREADRNHPFIHAGISKRAINTVGAALRLQYLPNWAALKVDPTSKAATDFVQAVENHFSLWAEDFRLLCDAQRQGQFGAMMLLACREALGTEGETLVISRYDEERQANYRADYATCIEIVSCDRLSTPSNMIDNDPSPNARRVVAGKEIDQYGAAVAYHVQDSHPADRQGEQKWTRVVRETEWGRPVGIHFFFRHRAGQQRAMPAIIASLRSIKMLDKFDDAQLQSAVVNAILSIFIESEGTPAEILQQLTAATPTGGNNVLADLWDRRFDYYENNELTADGVRIPVLPPGDKIKMEMGSRGATDTKDFRTAYMRAQAAELNLTYEQFSGDYSDTTFSSARAALIDVWRLISADRILFTQHVAQQIFVGFLEELWVRADELGIDWPADWPDFHDNIVAYSQCEFRGPGMGWVDPAKDAAASAARVDSALSSPTSEAAQQGQSFTDNIDQIARDHDYARSRGVAIPGMPEYAALKRSEKAATPDPSAAGADSMDPNEPARQPDGQFDGSVSNDQQQQDDKRRKPDPNNKDNQQND